MTKIYTDTNRFVDLYQNSLSTENQDLLKEVEKHKDNLVLTEQTISEFRRNRVSTLKIVRNAFMNSIKVNPHATWVLHSFEEFKKITTCSNEIKKLGKAIDQRFQEMIEDETKDHVAQKFMALVRDSSVVKLKTTDSVFSRAHKRKLLGNPPTTKDKHSIGDEVIWETLLENFKEDLIVVTNDHTFHDNSSILKEEFKNRTGHELKLVTGLFSEALKIIGQAPTKELIHAEKAEQEHRAKTRPLCDCSEPTPSGWMPNGRFLMIRCLKCGRVLANVEDPDIE